MKSFITAILIFCIMLTGMYFYLDTLADIKYELNTTVKKIEHEVEKQNWQQVDANVKLLSDKWDDVSKTLSYLTEHDEIDNVMMSVASIKEYSKYRETPELMAEIASLNELVDHIWSKERPIFENIL